MKTKLLTQMDVILEGEKDRNSLVLFAADGLFNHVTIAGDELEPTCGWVVCIASGIDMTAKLGTQSLQH